MQNQNSENGKVLELNIVSPDEEKITVQCDSVRFQIGDDLSGQGGGSYGVHIGHVKSVMVMQAGPVEARLNETLIFRADCKEGFVKVTPTAVTVVTEGFTIQ